jgi:hypothetical protein
LKRERRDGKDASPQASGEEKILSRNEISRNFYAERVKQAAEKPLGSVI